MALYDNPANRFVAAFLGTANLIDGRAEGQGGDRLFRADDGVTLPIASGGIEGPCAAMIRPQDLTIRAAGDDAMEPGAGTLDGRVRHREFLGSLIRYAIAIGTHVILVDDPHHAGRKAYALGEAVRLSLDGGDVRLLTE
jgi:iron(III) transport system ATP-binding protein